MPQNKKTTQRQRNKKERKVLVIEHNPHRQQFFADRVEALGATPLFAHTIPDALRHMHQLPDAIFLNLFLPHMTSLSFLGFKESHPLYRNIPVFLISNYEREDTLQEAFGESVVDLLDMKKYDPRDLEQALEEFFLDMDGK